MQVSLASREKIGEPPGDGTVEIGGGFVYHMRFVYRFKRGFARKQNNEEKNMATKKCKCECCGAIDDSFHAPAEALDYLRMNAGAKPEVVGIAIRRGM